jgi:hypothetical protein
MYIKTDLNEDQKKVLQTLFRRRLIEPHVVSQQLRIRRTDAIALLDSLVAQYPKTFIRRHLVYHNCSEAPVSSIDYGETIKLGWICPECVTEIELHEISLDLMYRAVTPVEFVEPS